MRSYRILHVDDDPLLRDVVDLSLGLEPSFALMICANGEEALAMTPDWAPDLILCDVMMPDMDGPAILAQLRKNISTAKIPVVFMTARAQPQEIERLKSLGAAGVIAKPFDPATLADTVRGHLRSAKFASAGYDFRERLRSDAAALATFRTKLRDQQDAPLVPEGLQSCARKLAGAAGVFEFQAVSRSASALEEAIIAQCAGRVTPGKSNPTLMRFLNVSSASSGADMTDTIEPSQKASPKMLIADDDPAIVRLLADRCMKMGFKVETAANGMQLLIKARRSQPDIMIVDVNMPEMDGLSVCTRLLDPGSKPVEVVVVTGGSDPETAERCESLGLFYGRKGPEFWKASKPR